MDFDQITGQLLERVDIVEIVSRYVNLKKAGKNFLGLCPFHTEKTPSFSVSPDKQIFKCFGCGKGGNAIHFLMEYEKLSFKETLELLAKETGVQLSFTPDRHQDERVRALKMNAEAAGFFQKEYEKSDPLIQQYLDKRGILPKTILEFKIGYAPDAWEKLTAYLRKKGSDLKQAEKLGLVSVSRQNKYIDRFRNRIMFPIIDLSGNVLGFGGRVLQPDAKAAKYINSPESLVYKKSEILFGLFNSREAIREQNRVIFTEGYLDMLQLYQNGIRNVVATSGTAFTEKQARLIKRFTNRVDLCFDSDEAGWNAILKAGFMILNYDFEVRVILIPGGEDPDSFVFKNGADAFMEQQENALSFNQFFIRYLSTAYDLKSFNSRQKAIQAALEMLSGLQNQLLAGYLLEEVAFITNAPLPTLNKQLTTLIAQKNRFSRRQNENEATSSSVESEPEIPMPAAERDLVVLLLQGESSVNGIIMEQVPVEAFSHPGLRTIYEQICMEFDDHGQVDGNKIISAIKNPPVLETITRRMMDDYGDPVQYAEDTILNLLFNNAKREKEKIQLQIKKSEKEGAVDPQLIGEFQKALNEMKRLGAILNEKGELK